MTPIKTVLPPSLSRTETPRYGGQRLIRLGGLTGLILGVITTHAWISSRFTRPSSPAVQELILHRQPGPRAQASRCSDCPQPGDVVTARGTPGSDVYVFHRDALWLSCLTCTSITFTLPELGQFDVAAVEAATSTGCVVSGNFDLDLLRLRECGANVSTAKINVR